MHRDSVSRLSVAALCFSAMTLSVGAAILSSRPAQAQAQAITPAKAKLAFQSCAICHSEKAGASGLGPSLAGIFGKPAGQVKGFKYSPAMSTAKVRWDRETLDAFIAKPKTVVPGTRMSYPGVSDPAKRQAIIDYIQALR